ncbi:MAG TPA: hypothetical protein ENG33_03610, partial [Chloroflexi bacterium]|nr:hypothetical protein [Chloroflexota bacterium]
MKGKWILTGILVITALLALAVGFSLAQGPGEEEEVGAQGDVSAAAYISPVMSYQGRLVENGNPVNGTKSMTFRLYDAETGGTKIWEEGPKDVDVSDGLFHVTLGDTTSLDVNDLDQELWLEIEVDGTTLPRQRLMGAPYAFSLVPGADIRGSIGSGWSILYVRNEGSGLGVHGYSNSGIGVYGYSSEGHGVYAQSAGSAYNGSALEAKNTNSSGIAIWASNDSTDTTLVVENEGSGPLIKGFGGDGGEDEFRVNNDGSIETKADSYIFISGNEFVKNVSDEDTQWDCQPNGSVKIWSPGGDSRNIYIP